MDNELAKQSIERSFPGFHIEAIRFIAEGFDSCAYEVNNEYIFLFPKSSEAAKQLRVEIALLPRLLKHVDIQIPSFEYIGSQLDNGFPFVGYKKIEGVALDNTLLTNLDESSRTQFIKQLANFLQRLHSFPIADAEQCEVMISDEKKFFTHILERMRSDVYPMMRPLEQTYVEHTFKRYLDDDGNFDYNPVLLHADLGLDHILYDAHKRDIAGIIDFGDVRIGDPVYDLIYLHQDFSRELIDSFVGYFPRKHFGRLQPKLQFFVESNTAVDILYWGMDNGNDAVLRESLEKLSQQAQTHRRSTD